MIDHGRGCGLSRGTGPRVGRPGLTSTFSDNPRGLTRVNPTKSTQAHTQRELIRVWGLTPLRVCLRVLCILTVCGCVLTGRIRSSWSCRPGTGRSLRRTGAPSAPCCCRSPPRASPKRSEKKKENTRIIYIHIYIYIYAYIYIYIFLGELASPQRRVGAVVY